MVVHIYLFNKYSSLCPALCWFVLIVPSAGAGSAFLHAKVWFLLIERARAEWWKDLRKLLESRGLSDLAFKHGRLTVTRPVTLDGQRSLTEEREGDSFQQFFCNMH